MAQGEPRAGRRTEEELRSALEANGIRYYKILRNTKYMAEAVFSMNNFDYGMLKVMDIVRELRRRGFIASFIYRYNSDSSDKKGQRYEFYIAIVDRVRR